MVGLTSDRKDVIGSRTISVRKQLILIEANVFRCLNAEHKCAGSCHWL